MKNQFVSDILYQIADLLDLKGEIFFKTRAYRIAAQTIEVLDEDIEKIAKEERLEEIPGIGSAIAKKIKELLDTNKIEYFEKLKKEIPPGLLKMLNISGLGPKKVSKLFKELNIKTIDELRDACKKGKLRDLDGFGEITERNILRGIKLMEKTSGRVLLNLASENGESYIAYLKKNKAINKISIAGSLRRKKETIGDIDILAASNNPESVMDYFVNYENVKRVLLKGSTKTSVLLNEDIQVDLRVVEDKSFGSALQYFTGSKEHNVKMRSIAIKNGYKLNEYGLFSKKDEGFIVGENEKEIYEKLGLKYIEPELRENRGEIEASLKNDLPDLVEYQDIKGDFHVHSVYSDGFETIENIVKKAIRLGYEYIGIADHSQSLIVAKGLSENRIEKKRKEIEDINKKMKDIRVLCGTECDIKADGKMDYSNRILKNFDFVYAAIHTNFKMSSKEITKRIISAMENEYVDFIAHPSCRILGRREGFDLDMNKIFDAAKRTDTYLEINSFPDRLDLNDIQVKFGKEKKVKFVLGSDSHNINHLSFLKYGISTARRGWLEKKDILNTKNKKEIIKHLEL